MSEFVRPAISESDFEKYELQEWEMSEAEAEDWVSSHLEDRLNRHLFCSVQSATPAEARAFWLDGGWDDEG